VCVKTLQECRSQNPLRIREKKLRRNNVLRAQVRTQIRGARRGKARVEAFSLREIFQASEESAKAREEHSCRPAVGSELTSGELRGS
jgi:hypothetical protein